MSNHDADKKSASESTPLSQKPGTELQDNELDEISGGIAFVKPANADRKKPNKFVSDP